GIIYRYLLFSFFLFRVVSHYGHQAVRQKQTNTAVFFIGKNGGAGKRLFELQTGTNNYLVATSGQYPLVIRKFPVNQFGSEGVFTGSNTNMVGTESDLYLGSGIVQQTR